MGFFSVKGCVISFDLFLITRWIHPAIKFGEMKELFYTLSSANSGGISQKGQVTPVNSAKLQMNSDSSLVMRSLCARSVQSPAVTCASSTVMLAWG